MSDIEKDLNSGLSNFPSTALITTECTVNLSTYSCITKKIQYICYWTSVWSVLGKYWSSFCSKVYGLGRFFGTFMDWAAGAVHKFVKKGRLFYASFQTGSRSARNECFPLRKKRATVTYIIIFHYYLILPYKIKRTRKIWQRITL